ncbi:hypothetical protein [Actinoallomurus sp. CA-142502]|uniref:hypothetical protein n=1 Tax=Actinoallomurus sp. CA-142502 TaxID=3239885 RepID=UPI003D8C273F
MAVAALVISIVSLLVAGLAAWFTWRQTRAEEAATSIERKRHHAEREPAFEGRVKLVSNSGWHRLDLRLAQGGPLAKVTVTIVEGDGVEFAGNQYGVPGPAARATAFTINPLKRDELATWRVLLADSRSSRIRLVCECSDDAGDTWEVSTWVDLPPKVRISVW